MKMAYFDCFSGISGDMTIGAMIDAGTPLDHLREQLARLDLAGYSISAEKVKKCGVTGTKFHVHIDETKHKNHRHYPDIVKLIENSSLSDDVKSRALTIFHVIALAESEVHGVSMEKVHFHEVGAVDSVVDIVGAAIGFATLGIDEIYTSPVNVGSGSVRTQHGILPVPAPATALILRGVPTYADGPDKELTTPTGAAIVKAMSKGFGRQPLMAASVIGSGAGGYDFRERPNILRLFIGEKSDALMVENLVELETNIDDMNPQLFPLVMEKLLAAGALDVTLTPIQMKKGRPATTLTALCGYEKVETLEKLIFTETTTLGVKRRGLARVCLPREIVTVDTAYGPVEMKIAKLPGGGVRKSPEFESVKQVAAEKGVPFSEVYGAVIGM